MSNYADLLEEGTQLARMGNNLEPALLRFQAAQALAPEGRSEAWSNAGIILERLGRTQEAIDCFREATRRDDTSLIAWENFAYLQGKLDKTAGVFAWDDVLERWPERASAWANRGALLVVAGDQVEAEKSYRRALELDQALDVVRAALRDLEQRHGDD